MAHPHAALRRTVLVIALAAAALAAVVFAGRGSAAAIGQRGSQGEVRRQANALRELPELRTARSRTFSTGHGTQLTRMYAAPVNFRSGGRWTAIDDGLVQSGRPGYALENAADSYTLSLPDALDARPVEVRNGSDLVRFALEGAKGSPTGSGVEARYAGALPGVSLAYEAHPGAVKESLVLASPRAHSGYVFKLDTSAGLRARENASGGIDFVRDGRVRLTFRPPTMHDSARQPAGSTAVKLALRGDEVVLKADRDWLDSPQRTYPVVIDPTTIIHTNDDCYMVSGTDANTTFCGYTDPYIQIGLDGNGNQRRMFARVDMSAIPKYAEVLEGEFQLYVEAGTQRAVSAYHATRQSTSARTWNKYDGVNAWTTPGGDFGSSPDGTNPAVGGSVGLYRINARKLAQGWLDGTIPNYGAIFKDNGATAGVLTITGDQATNDPIMEVEWANRTGVQDRWTFSDQQLSDRATLKTNVANGNVILEENDVHIPGTAGHDLDFKRYFNNLEFDTSSDDDLGQYWRSDAAWDVWLRSSGLGSTMNFNGPSDFWAPYDQNGSGYTTPTGMNADLVKNADGTYTLTYRQSNRKLNFDSTGNLTSDKDRNSNTISYAYGGPGGKLTSIRDTHDQGTTNNTLSVAYTAAGYIDKITDRSTPTVRTWDYNYTGSKLTSYVNPDGKTTTYGYDASDNLSDITDGRGYRTHIDYDTQHRVTAIQRDAANAGPITRYEYPTTLSAECQGAGGSAGTLDEVVGETLEHDPLWPQTGTTHTVKYCWDRLLRVRKTVDGLGHPRKTGYTANSDVNQLTSAGAQQWALDYPNDRLETATAPAAAGQSQGLQQVYGYDANHASTTDPLHWLPISFKDEQKNTSNYDYDSKGNLLHVKLPLANTPMITVVPNTNGTTQAITDANGTGATTYGYYANGDLQTITRPGGLQQETLTYDAVHRIATHANGRRASVTETYSYDPIDRMTSISAPSVTTAAYGYDANGNLTSRTDATGTSTYTYDGLNRLKTESLPGGRTNTYGYDAAGNLTSLQDAGGTTTYTPGNSNLLSSMQAPGDSAATVFGYNNDDQRTKTTYPNGVVLTMDYEDMTDTAGNADPNDKGPNRLKSIEAAKSGVTQSKFSYGYLNSTTVCGGTQTADTAQRQKVTDANGKVTTYCYDGLNRLVKADNGVAGPNYAWTLDANGNVTKVVKGSSATSFGFDTANRMCWSVGSSQASAACSPAPAGATTYGYDAAGNLQSSSAGLAIAYNNYAQPTSMTGLSGGAATSMGYAGANNFERFTSGGTTFTNNALGVGAETSGTSTTYYRRDDEGGLVSERTPSGAIYYYAFDGLGSVVGLSDSGGTTQQRYSYEPYGETTLNPTTPAVANPFRYASSYQDSTGFYKMGMRYYRPELMRWTQQDAVEDPTDPDQADRYAYVGGDPISQDDPNGTSILRGLGRLLWKASGIATRVCFVVGTYKETVKGVRNPGYRTSPGRAFTIVRKCLVPFPPTINP